MTGENKPELTKPELTGTQKRLLRLVYIMGAVLVVLFVFVLGAIVYQIVHY